MLKDLFLKKVLRPSAEKNVASPEPREKIDSAMLTDCHEKSVMDVTLKICALS